MNIIIEPNDLESYKSKYTVLELDTIRILPEGREVTAYCIVENIPVADLPILENKKSLHENLILNYRKKDWNYCTQALDHLIGSWNSELDSFDNDLRNRIAKYVEQDPGDAWDGIIEKGTSTTF